MVYEASLRSTIEQNACIGVIEEERTGHHCRVSNCFPVAYSQYPPCSSSIPRFGAVPLKVACFTTSIAGWARARARDLVDRLCRELTESDGVSFLVAVRALQFTAGAVVVVAAFVALGRTSSIPTHRSSSSSSRGYCGMNCHQLLLFGSLLLLPFIPEFPLSIGGFGGFRDG